MKWYGILEDKVLLGSQNIFNTSTHFENIYLYNILELNFFLFKSTLKIITCFEQPYFKTHAK